MAFTINSIQAITQNYIAPQIVDNTSKGTPYMWWLRENGRISVRGGLTLRFPIVKSHLNFDWYSGMDAATLEALEPFTSASFNWYNGRVPFVIPEEDIDKNNGPDGIVDIVDATTQTGTATLMEQLATALMGSNSSNPKQPDGLQDMFAATGTSYGGLLDTDFTSPATWLTSRLDCLTNNVLTALDMRRLRGSVTRGPAKPNLGLCNFPTFARIWAIAQGNQRFGMEKIAKIGFDHVMFEDMVIMPDEHCEGSGFTQTDNVLWFLNTDYIKFVVHESKAFISRVYAPIPQIEAYIGKLLFMVSHGTSQRRAHAEIDNIDPADAS